MLLPVCSLAAPLLLGACTVAVAVASTLATAGQPAAPEALKLTTEQKVMQLNAWINSFFFRDSFTAMVEESMGKDAAHYLLTYLRDLVSGSILYYVTAGLWHLYIYSYKGEQYFTVSRQHGCGRS